MFTPTAEPFHYALHCDHHSFALNILVSTSGLSEVDRIQNFDLEHRKLGICLTKDNFEF